MIHRTLFETDFSNDRRIGCSKHMQGEAPGVGDKVTFVEYDSPDPITQECIVTNIRPAMFKLPFEDDYDVIYECEPTGEPHEFGMVAHQEPAAIIEHLKDCLLRSEALLSQGVLRSVPDNPSDGYMHPDEYRREIAYVQATYCNGIVPGHAMPDDYQISRSTTLHSVPVSGGR